MRTPSGLALWCLAATAAARVAGADPLDERVDPTLPDYIVKTAPIGDGRVLVLGGSVVATGWPSIAQHTQRAVLTGTALPDVGEAFDITTGDGTAWVLGSTSVAFATSGGPWRQIAIAPREALRQHVVALDATHALVLRAGTAEVIDAAAGKVDSVVELASALFAYAVSDGSGGAWTTIVGSQSSTIGYAHVAHGTWTLWPLPKEHADELVAAGFHVAAPLARNVLPTGEMVSDGHGGWFAPEVSGVTHVASDGAASFVAMDVRYGRFAFAWAPTRDHLLMLKLPDKPLLDAPRLVELDHDGNEVSREVIPTPGWYREPIAFPPFLPAMSQDATTTWIAFGTMVFAHQGASWRVAYAPTVRDRARQLHDTSVRKHRDASRSGLAFGFSMTGGSILAGTLGATAIHGDERASAAMLGGTVGAFAPQLLIDAMIPGPWNDHASGGPGMPRLASSTASDLHWVGFVTGVLGATTLAGVGAWEAGKAADLRTPPDGAAYGAFAGAGVGTAASVVVTSWMSARWPERTWLRIMVGSTLIGASASLGYQLGGGGP